MLSRIFASVWTVWSIRRIRTQLPYSNFHGYKPNFLDTTYWYTTRFYQRIPKDSQYVYILDAVRANALNSIYLNIESFYLSPDYPGTLRDAERGIRAMIKRPYYKDAICHCSNKRLTIKWALFKYLLRLPTAWPLIAAHRLKQVRKRIKGNKE